MSSVEKKRLGYIDALRGFSMFLVVFGHISIISFRADTVVASIFMTFRMPLFFFISGFIGYKALEFWTSENYIKRLGQKAFVQLVPMILFSMLYIFVKNRGLVDYVSHGFREYWFTFVLFQMFVVYFSISRLSHLVGQWLWYVCLILVALFGVVYLAIGNREISVWSFLCLENVCKYFQFFVLGLFCRKHLSGFVSLVSKEAFKATIIVAFILLFCIISIEGLNDISYRLLHDIVIRYVGVFMVFAIFYSAKDYFDQNHWLSNTLKFVGKRTLDIYLLHYFFLPKLKVYNGFLADNQQPLFELMIYTVLAISVISICLACSWYIRRSDTLAYWCFGSKKK